MLDHRPPNVLNVWLNNVTFNSSTSTFRKVTLGIFLANSARNGAMNLQGPHQEAVKSTTICNTSKDEKHRVVGKLCHQPTLNSQNTYMIQLAYMKDFANCELLK